MNNIMEWLDEEQEHKLVLEDVKNHKNRGKNENNYNKMIANMNSDCVKLCLSRATNIHPEILKRYGR